MLRVEGVRVTMKGFIILRGISLDIPSGGLIGLVGRNGAGKTTTLKSIIGIMPVSAGSVQFDGEDLLQIPAHRRAHLGIGYMPEERRLIGALTVQDNIMMPSWASRTKTGNERLDYIYQLMPEVRGWSDRKATQLSGGQQKMVALARALMNGTKLLLLDEPFEGLAPLLGEKLGETIQDIQKQGLSVLIAESDDRRLSFVQEIYTIERGEIVRTGNSNGEGQ
jgi:branched-chain amino acid transport system ATP-binding protein